MYLRGLSHGEAHIVVASSPQPLSGGLNDTGKTDGETRRIPHLVLSRFYTSTPKNLQANTHSSGSLRFEIFLPILPMGRNPVHARVRERYCFRDKMVLSTGELKWHIGWTMVQPCVVLVQ